MQKTYSVYITTNPSKEILYTGVTNDLPQRVLEHYLKRGISDTFAGKYYCYNLIFYEDYARMSDAIVREKEIKSWSRSKKEELIATTNKNWTFLNFELFDRWPPPKNEHYHRGED